jgi:hypothetical protein
MSIDIMSMVFKRYPNGGGEMLLALALADHAHDDGTHIYPSVDHLAQKTRQSVRSVQYQLKGMLDAGFIELTNEGHGGRGMHREYRINPLWVKGADFASLKMGANSDGKGAIGDGKGANGGKKGCSSLHPLDNPEEPSGKHQESSPRASRLKKEWVLPKKWGEWALANDPTWTPEFVRLQAEKFRDYWVAVPGRAGLKLDWEATWRNRCRDVGPMPAAGKAGAGAGAAWWLSEETKLAKAMEVGVGPAHRGEPDSAWQARIRAAIDNGGKPPEATRPAQAVTIRDPGAPEAKKVISDENRAALLAAKQALKRGPGLSPDA